MTKSEVKKLKLGLYRLFFKNDNGMAVAAVGQDEAGNHWFAPSNWLCSENERQQRVPCFDWRCIKRAELITTQKEQMELAFPPVQDIWDEYTGPGR